MSETSDRNARDARKAAELQPDMGMEQIGEIYAKALLGLLRKSGDTKAVIDEFDSFMAEVIDRSPKLEAVLSSPLVSHKEKVGILDRVLDKAVSPLLLDFFKVVSRRGRLDSLRAIHRQVHSLYEEMLGLVHVRLTTASPLDPALVAQITKSLGASLGSEPIVEPTVDPRLIGGVILRVGDTVYDGSIANQLQTVRQQMIDRSVHEIQSRRDSFRNTTGS